MFFFLLGIHLLEFVGLCSLKNLESFWLLFLYVNFSALSSFSSFFNFMAQILVLCYSSTTPQGYTCIFSVYFLFVVQIEQFLLFYVPVPEDFLCFIHSAIKQIHWTFIKYIFQF